MCTSLSLPTPVVIAYEILLLATSTSTTARARLTASRASGSRRTGRRVCATSRTASRVRSFPLMCRACKSVLSSQLSTSVSDGCPKRFQVFLGQRARVHLCIGDDVRGLAFGQQLAGFRVSQFVSEVNHFLPDVFQVRAHDDLVIIVYGSLVAAAGIDYSDEAVVFALHIFIAEAELAKEFHPSHFKPDEVIGVINNAHLVGFSIADADPSFIHRRWGTYVDRCRCVGIVHRPVHFGLRFSRNDVMPSRKSALSRMPAFSRMAASICESSSARA